MNFKINEALDAHNREAFLSLSSKLQYAQRVKNKIPNAAGTDFLNDLNRDL
ncbi:IDEAL domain-containing protein [Priestia megaterium]|uniref:IDEAL domain-containing protein n=1 Tax=Priestia megaterium TaxID=1404 RepID=UPI0012935B58